MNAARPVLREDGPERGRYVVRLGGAEAEMTYRRLSPAVMRIDHTGVPPEFSGQGIAASLLAAALADARREGFRIVPRCPYVAAQFRRHPEWADLLVEDSAPGAAVEAP